MHVSIGLKPYLFHILMVPVGAAYADISTTKEANMSETKAPPQIPQIRRYQNWLREQRGLRFDSYHALWRWSVTDLDAYWQSVWDYFDLQSPTPHTVTH